MLRSVLSNWIATLLSGAISIALTPVLIHGLGDFHFGMWVLVGSLLEYSSFIDVGLRTTLQRFAARLEGAHNRLALNETLSTSMVLSGAVFLGICLLTGVCAAVLPGFFGLKGHDGVVLTRVIVLLGLSVAVTFPARVLASYLCGLQRYDVYNGAAVATSAVRAVLLVLVLRLGYGVLACCVANLAVAGASLVAHWALVRWVDPASHLRIGLASRARIRELFSFGFYVFLASIGDFLRYRIDSFVIARWISLALVTPFSIAGRITEYYRIALFTVTGPLMTTMSALEGQQRRAELQDVFLRFTRVTSLMSFLIGSMLWLHGKWLIGIWTGEKYVSAYPSLMILVLGTSAAAATTPSVNLLLARGENRPVGWWGVGEGLANLGLSIYWAGKYGIAGVALGTTVPQLFVKFTLQPWYALRAAEVSLRDYFVKGLARPLAAGVIFLAVGKWLVLTWGEGTLVHVLALFTAEGALYMALAYSVGLEGPDRSLLLDRGRTLLATFAGTRAPVGPRA
jgi:O-antigen/teichoic acid export membrane protein